ncbi:hypothetical protein NUW54_g9791 [Trametes sanguinea]|uniref:Uncharacterized protein n=1 Tax=Trametes sanguinea TaxID=158606 RepID=A0ACC1P5Q5_9APHY|nr:hypothetical protein NUW54_g9791 [Trametes sanguinea]
MNAATGQRIECPLQRAGPHLEDATNRAAAPATWPPASSSPPPHDDRACSAQATLCAGVAVRPAARWLPPSGLLLLLLERVADPAGTVHVRHGDLDAALWQDLRAAGMRRRRRRRDVEQWTGQVVDKGGREAAGAGAWTRNAKHAHYPRLAPACPPSPRPLAKRFFLSVNTQAHHRNNGGPHARNRDHQVHPGPSQPCPLNQPVPLTSAFSRCSAHQETRLSALRPPSEFFDHTRISRPADLNQATHVRILPRSAASVRT